MGKEQQSDFYDSRMDRVLVPYEESPWRPIYDTVVEFLHQWNPAGPILDVGCGTGRCAEALRRAGFVNYQGIDFSGVRINEAQDYVPSFTFKQMDVFSADAEHLFAEHGTFIITEVLEHITKDRELIRRLPRGSKVIISVPNYDSAGHVRTFSSARDIDARYSDLLDFDADLLKEISRPKRPERLVWVRGAVRR
ncbi:class I SAM-dependent methyltransferase [Halofilum ochraceum]|uniref:class I SAM-dependent methyltransferase n=1 Tax=Halofilum ochraceum TaxID=1611323 RepID=UPI0009472640|nr:class I SAM-dependent methyltransferase [Halofilum ochraceum]